MAYGDTSICFPEPSSYQDYTHVPCDQCKAVEIVVRYWTLKCPGHEDGIVLYLCFNCAPGQHWKPPCEECGKHTTPMWFQLEPLKRTVYERTYGFNAKTLRTGPEEALPPREMTLRCDKCVSRDKDGNPEEGWIDP